MARTARLVIQLSAQQVSASVGQRVLPALLVATIAALSLLAPRNSVAKPPVVSARSSELQALTPATAVIHLGQIGMVHNPQGTPECWFSMRIHAYGLAELILFNPSPGQPERYTTDVQQGTVVSLLREISYLWLVEPPPKWKEWGCYGHFDVAIQSDDLLGDWMVCDSIGPGTRFSRLFAIAHDLIRCSNWKHDLLVTDEPVRSIPGYPPGGFQFRGYPPGS